MPIIIECRVARDKISVAQVGPFLRPLLDFVRQRGSGLAKGRANAGLKALRLGAQASGSAAGNSAAGNAGAALGGAALADAAAAARVHGSNGGASLAHVAAAAGGLTGPNSLQVPGLKGTVPADFEEMLRLNAELRAKDRMAPYSGQGPTAAPVATAGSTMAAGAQSNKKAKNKAQAPQPTAKQAAPPGSNLRGLSAREAPLDFDAMLAKNQALRAADAMPAYEGVLPSYQVQARKAAAAAAPQQAASADAAVDGNAAAPSASAVLPLAEIQLDLPRIELDVERLRDVKASTRAQQGSRAAAREVPASGAPAAQAWLNFQLDRGSIQRALAGEP